ncbi:MAG: helix-hairpin-helix domain-containing protein, partial [Candidatus Thorarchaeota archaeon]
TLIAGTFFSCQFDQLELQHHVSSALTFLEDGKLIDSTASDEYSATPLGRRASRLYIDPYTAIMLRDTLTESKDLSTMGILHLICHTPDQPITYLTRSEYDEYTFFVEDNEDQFLIEPPFDDPDEYGNFLSEVKTARLLEEWISESSERDITEGFSVGMGDVHRYVRSAEWLVYSTSEIARVMNVTHHIPILYSLRSRLKYGVQKELLDLVSLRGIGRVRGRMLHSHGLKTRADLYSTPVDEIARIPMIGTTIAESIKRQLGLDVRASMKDEMMEEDEYDGFSIQTLLEDFEVDND